MDTLTASASKSPGGLPSLWAYPDPNRPDDPFEVPQSSPLIAAERVMWLGMHNVFAVDVFTGQLAFTFPLDPGDPPPPLVAARGRVYLVNGGNLVALDLLTGTVPAEWLNPAVAAVSAVELVDDLVLVCMQDPSSSGSLANAYTLTTGDLAWSRKITAGNPQSAGKSREAVLYVDADDNGRLVATNFGSGCERFRVSPASAETGPEPLDPQSTPVVGEVFRNELALVSGTRVFAVDLVRGTTAWSHAADNPTPNDQWRIVVCRDAGRVLLANVQGGVSCVELSSGRKVWSAPVPDPGIPVVVGTRVYVGETSGSGVVHVLALETGEAVESCALGSAVARLGIPVWNGMAFPVVTPDPNQPARVEIQAVPFGPENAFRFDGSGAYLEIDPIADDLDLGKEDFTLEAWVCTARGGEVLFGYPRRPSPENHGFRLNISPEGQLRFAVASSTGSNQFAGRTRSTSLCDGFWHHVAVVRRSESVELYVDGLSQKVLTRRQDAGSLALAGHLSLTVGAFTVNPERIAQAFDGQIRELRIWKTAVEPQALKSRMRRALTGLEPNLIGYWRMSERDPSQLVCEGRPGAFHPTVVSRVQSTVCDLGLDDSAFPFRLELPALPWPYQGHWSVAGEDAVVMPPARLDAVTCFGTGTALYGVDELDGARRWSFRTPEGASRPVGFGGRFYVLTGEDGLVGIDSRTGKSQLVTGFAGLVGQLGATLPAPVLDGKTIAAAYETQAWVVNPTLPDTDPAQKWTCELPGAASGDLQLEAGKLYVPAGSTLVQLDPATRAVQSCEIGPAPFLVSRSRLVSASPGRPGQLCLRNTTNLSAPAPGTYDLPPGSTVTGLAADPDNDLLVVCTSAGTVHGLTLSGLGERWTRALPPGPGADPALFAPALEGRNVFCTSRSGSAAALDARTGELRGFLVNPSPVATAPEVHAGTLYFGCDKVPFSQVGEDGALHSVVFGETNVLRLNLSPQGDPVPDQDHARITAGEALASLNGEWLCVETWINTCHGGEILSVVPGAVPPHSDNRPYGLRFGVDPFGTLQFEFLEAAAGGSEWVRVSASAGTHTLPIGARTVESHACDGRWHHVAVCRTAADEVLFYFDGTQIRGTVETATVAEPALAPTLLVGLGADLTGAEASGGFSGMIAEIRVWDTYLIAREIADRMHVKLVGDEPDLIAYWSFDSLDIHDTSQHGHDGTLVVRDSHSGFWLSDLSFTHPAYPHLLSHGALADSSAVAVGAAGDTEYLLTLATVQASGAPDPGCELTLWYVRHANVPGPDSVRVSWAGGEGDVTLAAVGPGHGDESCLKVKTGTDGKLVLHVFSHDAEHGPSIDVRADFMPANERYHVNVLIDSQKLVRPAPPHLEAVSRLIADYHWTTGDKLDLNRDRSTHRVTLRARNADGSPRPFERITLWGHDHTEIEVGGRAYPVNPQNGESFTANAAGELTVVVGAVDLSSPPLSAWAGFMHRGDRFTVPVGKDMHDQLAAVQGPDLLATRSARYRKDDSGQLVCDQESVLDPNTHSAHAENIATATRSLLSVSQPGRKPDPALLPATRRRNGVLRQPPRRFVAQQPPPRAANRDTVPVLRTLTHIQRRTPLEPQNLRRVLDSIPELRGACGFVLSGSTAGNTLEPIRSREEFARYVSAAPASNNIFEDAVDDIKDAAEDLAEKVKEIAVHIAETVSVAINGAMATVVHTVEQAVSAVTRMFTMILEAIEKAIERLIMLLRLLFDFLAIRKAYHILADLVGNQLRFTQEMLTDPVHLPRVHARVKSVVRNLRLHRITGPEKDQSAGAVRQKYGHPAALAELHTVHATYVQSKIDDRPDECRPPDCQHDPPAVDGGGLDGRTHAMVRALGSVLEAPGAAVVGDMADALISVFSEGLEELKDTLERALASQFSVLAATFGVINDAINTSIYLPFISELFDLVFGGDITILNMVCLVLAFLLHYSYGVITAAMSGGEPRTLADDLAPYRDRVLTPDQVLGNSLPGAGLPAQDCVLDFCYAALYWVYGGFEMRVKSHKAAAFPNDWRTPDIGVWCFACASFGIAAKSLRFAAAWTREGNSDRAWPITTFAISAIQDLYLGWDYVMGNAAIGRMGKVSELAKGMFSFSGAILFLSRGQLPKEPGWSGAMFVLRDEFAALQLMLSFDTMKLFLTANSVWAWKLYAAEWGFAVAESSADVAGRLMQ